MHTRAHRIVDTDPRRGTSSSASPTRHDGRAEPLVRVHAAGVDRGVWHLMTGLPYVARPAFGFRAPKSPVPGMDLAGGDPRYDLILDIGGNSSLSRLRRTLAPMGTLVIVGGEGGGRWLGGTDRQLRAMMLSPFVGQKLLAFVPPENHEDMIALKERIESGNVMPVIDRTYPLAEVPEAIRYLEEGHARGKVVIRVRP